VTWNPREPLEPFSVLCERISVLCERISVLCERRDRAGPGTGNDAKTLAGCSVFTVVSSQRRAATCASAGPPASVPAQPRGARAAAAPAETVHDSFFDGDGASLVGGWSSNETKRGASGEDCSFQESCVFGGGREEEGRERGSDHVDGAERRGARELFALPRERGAAQQPPQPTRSWRGFMARLRGAAS
jgi:hypothetical protein